jgi:hypothetical protein
MRLLALPQAIQEALSKGKISEGHTRPLLMLTDKKEEQMTLFREMLIRKMTVREAENLARKVAQDKVRKKQYIKDPNILEMETSLAEKLGTRVHIAKRDVGGVIEIDFFSIEDLAEILEQVKEKNKNRINMADKFKNAVASISSENLTHVNIAPTVANTTAKTTPTMAEIRLAMSEKSEQGLHNAFEIQGKIDEQIGFKDMAMENIPDNNLVDDRAKEEIKKDDDSDDEDLYNIKNFTL